MRAYLCAVCVGILLVGTLPGLSCLPFLIASIPIVGELLINSQQRSGAKLRIFYCCIIFGATWHGVWAHQRLHNIVPQAIEGVDLLIAGRIVTIPVENSKGQRFEFEVIGDPGYAPQLRGRLLLNTFYATTTEAEAERLQWAANADELELGQVWQLLVRLKRPHGYANPGGSDREAHLLRRNIVGSGYVRSSDKNIRLDSADYPPSFLSVRAEIWSRLQFLLDDFPQKGLMLALLMGEQIGITDSDWELFTATGTNHLFVISGLHVGLVAFGAYSLLWRLLALLTGSRYAWPTQITAAVAALLVCIAYSALAGFSLPTQRACIMVAVFLIGIPFRLRIHLTLRFLLALTLLLLMDPLSVTSRGFWFSFIAVAALILFASDTEPLNKHKMLKSNFGSLLKLQFGTQITVFIALSVPLLSMMGQVSLIAPLVNLIAIPLLGLVIVPTLILASLLSFFAEGMAINLFLVSDQLLSLLLAALQAVSAQFISSSFLVHGVNEQAVLFGAAGAIVLLLPIDVRFRLLAIPFFLPLLMPKIPKPENGQLWVDVIDVGQGLSVLLRTREHSLLFDTGPGEEGNWSAAEFVVTPLLNKLGVNELDRLVISHSDDDHAGGLTYLQQHFPGTEIIGHELTNNRQCRAGDRWHWDGVQFEFLHPDRKYGSSNDGSCVLQVRAGSQGLLLPGDIGADIEWDLAANLGKRLNSTVLVAAHHGSATSSSYPFLKMVDPRFAVFSAGYRNAFSHPADLIQARYDEWGIETFNTANSGMLSFKLGSDQAGEKPIEYRQMQRKYWSWSDIPWSCRYC